MNKTGLNDNRLSLQAKGLLCYLLSKPDNWYVNTDDIIAHTSNRIKSIRTAMTELIHFRYMFKHQFRNKDGTYDSYNYLIYENPKQSLPIKTTTYPKRPFRSSVKPFSDKDTLLSNKDKKLITAATTQSSVKSNKSKLSAAELDYHNTRNQTLLLLKHLNITNSKKLFDIFNISDIFRYATWIQHRNCRMSNPTGFLITAIKEKWLDNLDSHTHDQETLLFYYRCSKCLKVFGYEDPIPDYSFCIKCGGKY